MIEYALDPRVLSVPLTEKFERSEIAMFDHLKGWRGYLQG